MTRPEPEKKQSGLSLQTLIISSLAAATSAIVVPMFWERGSVLATAVTPIIVAVVSEALRKPADVIAQAPKKVAKRSATGAAVRSEQPTGVGSRGAGPEVASRWGGTPDDPFGLRRPVKRKRRFPWRLTIATGLVAAVVGGGIVTASELAIFGHQIGNPDRETGLLGGTPRDRSEPTPTPTATAEPSQTAAPSATATPSASATTTPTVAPSVEPRALTPTPTPPAGATPIPTPTP